MLKLKSKSSKFDHTITIHVNWNCLQSIKQAEKDKLNLENKGYTQINSFGGLNETSFIYVLLKE
jgi:hypothetical protein